MGPQWADLGGEVHTFQEQDVAVAWQHQIPPEGMVHLAEKAVVGAHCFLVVWCTSWEPVIRHTQMEYMKKKQQRSKKNALLLYSNFD